MKPSSKKNIHPVMSDIKQPRARAMRTAPASRETKNLFKPKAGDPLVIKSSSFRFWRKAVLIALVIVLTAALGFGWYLWNFKNNAFLSASSIYENLKSAASSLVNLENDSVHDGYPFLVMGRTSSRPTVRTSCGRGMSGSTHERAHFCAPAEPPSSVVD